MAAPLLAGLAVCAVWAACHATPGKVSCHCIRVNDYRDEEKDERGNKMRRQRDIINIRAYIFK